MDSAKVFFIDVPTMNTVVTSARPIMSAEAVLAVRSGLRVALRWARRPGVRKIGAIGRPRVPATGTATTGLSWATPMNTARAPSASRPTMATVSSATQRPATTSALPVRVSAGSDPGAARAGPGEGHEPFAHPLDRRDRRGSASRGEGGEQGDAHADVTQRRGACGPPGSGPARGVRSRRLRGWPGVRWR